MSSYSLLGVIEELSDLLPEPVITEFRLLNSNEPVESPFKELTKRVIINPYQRLSMSELITLEYRVSDDRHSQGKFVIAGFKSVFWRVDDSVIIFSDDYSLKFFNPDNYFVEYRSIIDKVVSLGVDCQLFSHVFPLNSLIPCDL